MQQGDASAVVWYQRRHFLASNYTLTYRLSGSVRGSAQRREWYDGAGVRAEWEEKLERMTLKINFGIKEWEERDKRWNGISGKDTKVHVKTDQAWCRLEKQEIRQLTSLGLLSYLHPSQLSLLNRYVSEKEAYGEKQTNRRVQEKISVWRRSITYRDKSTRRRKKGCSVCP